MADDLKRISREVSLEEGIEEFEAFFSEFLDYLRAELNPSARLDIYRVEDGVVKPEFHGLIDKANVYVPRTLLHWQIGWRKVGKLMRLEHPPDRRLSIHYIGLIPLDNQVRSLVDTISGKKGGVLASHAAFSSYEGEGSRFKPEEVPFPFSKPPYDS